MERLWRATVDAGARDLTIARPRRARWARSASSRTTCWRRSPRSDSRRAGGRSRSLPLPRHALEDEDRPSGLRSRGVDAAKRGSRSRRCSTSSAAARAAGSFAASLLLRPARARPATSSSTTSSPSRSSSGAGSTSRSGDGGRVRRRFVARRRRASLGARGGLRSPRDLGARPAERSPDARPDPRPRSRSRRPRQAQLAGRTSRSRSCSGSRRSGRIRAPRRRARWSRRWRPPGAPERRGDPARRRRRRSDDRVQPRRPHARLRRTSTARCGSGTRKRGRRSGEPFRAPRRRGLGPRVQPRRGDARVVELRRDRPALERRGPATCSASPSTRGRAPSGASRSAPTGASSLSAAPTTRCVCWR